MERIKNLSQVILRPDAILAEMVEIKRSTIILPGADESRDSLDYFIVVTTGTGVNDIDEGDYVVDIAPTDIGVYRINDKKYALLYRGNVRIAVKKDNFDLLNVVKDTSNLTI